MGNELKPEQIEVACHVDDRGFLNQIYGNYEFPEVKRIYVVGNFSRGVIRGFHRHNEEWKGYFIVKGSAKFVVVGEDEQVREYVLTDKRPSVLVIPPKYSHGWVSLADDTVMIGLSDKTLEESLKDDFREDPFKFGKEVWEVRPR